MVIKEIAIWGCGAEGIRFIRDWKNSFNIKYAIDNSRIGELFDGIEIFSPEHILKDPIFILVTTSFSTYLIIRNELNAMGLREGEDYQRAGNYIYHCFDKRRVNIKNHKDTHKNGRCFLIGNGPSLNIDDINLLKGEISFACNRIFGFFRFTDWRPTYYFMEDPFAIETLLDEAALYFDEIEHVFLADAASIKLKNSNITSYLYLHFGDGENATPKISENLEEGVCCGATVIFTMIQFAIYMGFTEIILLGVDMNYLSAIPTAEDYPKEFQNLDFSKASPIEMDGSIRAYCAAKKYASTHEIQIINATRGGNLEIFERKNLENIL